MVKPNKEQPRSTDGKYSAQKLAEPEGSLSLTETGYREEIEWRYQAIRGALEDHGFKCETQDDYPDAVYFATKPIATRPGYHQVVVGKVTRRGLRKTTLSVVKAGTSKRALIEVALNRQEQIKLTEPQKADPAKLIDRIKQLEATDDAEEKAA